MEQPTYAPGVERPERNPAGPIPLSDQEACDQKPRYDEEDVYTDEVTCRSSDDVTGNE